MKSKTIYEPEYEYIISQLRKARKEKKLRQQVVSDQIGKYESYISKIEKGDRRIDVLELIELAKVYKKNINYFIPSNNKTSKVKIKSSKKKVR